ncbi:hypothetical protein SAMN04489713_119111 [Actinomadura madurae]|uniref:Uncharacterized protein n=1 Tax=Actinomadura madurae TaxID=1993 RepID=A0A1I5UAA4_9ACTN|nr:hypothetical protein [Actinomadura madurae]SFP92190.1 hypothetical protein SAMN04489713_119111 [Actinomadura madurae]
MPFPPISTECPLRLRHETGRVPDEKRRTLTHVSFVDSTRQVRRPERGKAREVVVCDHCGRSTEFTVFSVKRAQRMRTFWFALLLPLLVLAVASLVLVFTMFTGVGPGYTDGLPTWAGATVIVSGIASMWAIGFILFFLSDEFGVRTRYRWRYTGQTVTPDTERGTFIGKCVGTWLEPGRPHGPDTTL